MKRLITPAVTSAVVATIAAVVVVMAMRPNALADNPVIASSGGGGTAWVVNRDGRVRFCYASQIKGGFSAKCVIGIPPSILDRYDAGELARP